MSSLNDNLKSVVLSNDDKSLTLEIGFYGYIRICGRYIPHLQCDM